jgi:hypothetical protein
MKHTNLKDFVGWDDTTSYEEGQSGENLNKRNLGKHNGS